ncbi:MAG: TonB-dependent receptor, partial [Acidobacteriia bacterium]|nr:TonB-dependent receptor [Terriglobia bacterium]
MTSRNWFLAACLCLPGYAFAQSTFGSILGTLQDSSGAVIAGGEVEITNLDENTIRKAISNDSGLYQFLNLPPGRYSLAANKSGFATARVPEITLEARQERRVDLMMGVTAVQQAVEVQAAGAVINTENATIGSTMTNQQITQLPANYRGASTSPLGAIVGLPNVQQDQTGAIALTGSLPFMTDYSVDGTSTVNVGTNSAARDMYPSSEMLAEFKVSAINNNAELASSGDVTVTTKSGGNTVHGSAFEYLQNRALDATTYGSSIKQAKVWNTFGGSLSGPVVIPKLYNGHNKTFFFVDYEGNRRPGSTLAISNVPTAAMIAGSLNGVPGKPAIDPSTGLPFPNNQVPASELNPVAQKLLTQYYPKPNFDSGSTTGNYRTLVPLTNTTDGFDIRIDHNVSSRHLIYGRWTWKDLPFLSTANTGLSQLLPPVTNDERNRNLLAADSFTISPNVINEFRFGYSDLTLGQTFPFSGSSAVTNLGLTGLDLSHAGNDGGFPGFNFSSGTGFSSIGHGAIGPSHSRTLQYTDNLTWIRGKHTAKFGIDWRTVSYSRINNFGASDEFGSLTFRGSFSGNAFADLLLGLPSTNIVFDIGPHIDQNSQHFAAYAQDEFKISKNVTLNFGLRWELQPPFSEKNGNIANFNPANGGMVYPDIAAKVLPPAEQVLYQINACPGVLNTLPCSPVQTASQAHLPQGLRYTYYRDFNPRISIAWRPFGDAKTVFRAGWGIYTVPQLGGVAYQMTGLASTPSLFYVNALVNGKPLFQLPSVAFGNGGLTPDIVGTYEYYVAQQIHYRDPESAQWNVTLEHQFGENWNARVSYIGENSFRLGMDTDQNSIRASTIPYDPLNVPYTQLGPIIQLGNWGFANYQALETQVSRRLASGLYLQATFDWAKDLSNAGG